VHASSLGRMQVFVDEHLTARRGQPLRVLDIGSSDVNGTYRRCFQDPSWVYVGLDLAPGPGVDIVVRQPYRWKEVPAGSFDVVVSGQAFEHIEFPWVTILEVARVLRPGGLLCLIVPSSGPEHRYPLDCWRFYTDGLVALAHWADLDVVSAETHWHDEGWGWESDQWHDAVLVAGKRAGKLAPAGAAKRMLVRVSTSLQAARRGLSGGSPDVTASASAQLTPSIGSPTR
jgi:SAM-dependent methyltransferase